VSAFGVQQTADEGLHILYKNVAFMSVIYEEIKTTCLKIVVFVNPAVIWHPFHS